jgi:3-oxoadipate CoA-transferase alpha subunit
MICKIVPSARAALEVVQDGATVMISGFGDAGVPASLIDALLERGCGGLTLISNNAGTGETGIAALLKAGRVRKVVCSFPRQQDSFVFDELYRAGKLELELVPQGTLAERIRAAGAGIPAFYSPTGYGTLLAEAKETRQFDDRRCVLETALPADVALIKAEAADRWGNVVYRKAGRNFGPIMAMAARHTICQVSRVVELGALDPEHIVTPGIFVDAIVAGPAIAAARLA